MHYTLIVAVPEWANVEDLMAPFNNAQWDWYEVGGRWPGRLTLKEGSESEPGVSFSWGWSEEEKKKFLAENPRCADRAKKKDVANLEDLRSWALLIDGEWIDVGDWNKDDKDLRVYDYLKDLDDEIELVCIDYHM